ncbi:unnamed protein product [Gongylonema pulchrum]|uniref:Uncharacterized protein n=1 Tax=Gongylonema pulchrum TaxID=637853 RepID=A0A183DYK8_9BILA|nr:unnamed protein product [Gongylonema pulchrum]
MYSQALRGWCTLAALFLTSISVESEVVPQNISYAKLFGTEQFLFVGLSKCYLSAELSPPPRNLIAQQYTIPWPRKRVASKYFFEKVHVNLENSYSYVGGSLLQEQVVSLLLRIETAVLFDSRYRTVYVLRNMSMHESVFDMECVTFYMQLMPDGRLIFHQLNVFRDVHPSNIGRMLWTEDPYHRKFYYAQKEKNKKMTIYSVPFGDILETLLDGKPGAPVQSFHGDDFRNLYGSLMTVVCNGTNPDIQQFDQSNSLRLLFDDDFCALQNANGGKCTVRGMRIVEEVIKEDQALSSYFWLIALIIALILVIMVLLICLYRRRNVMETTFTKMNRSQVQYYPTFSSERSFDY